MIAIIFLGPGEKPELYSGLHFSFFPASVRDGQNLRCYGASCIDYTFLPLSTGRMHARPSVCQFPLEHSGYGFSVATFSGP